MKLSKTYRLLFYALLLSFAASFFCEYQYKASVKKQIPVGEFNIALNKKLRDANKTLSKIDDIIIHSSLDSVEKIHFPSNDISYYVYEHGNLSFWSDNHADIQSLDLKDSCNWKYTELSNVWGVCKAIKGADDRLIVAFVSIKNNYPYENAKLINSFTSDFQLDKHIGIVWGEANDKLAVKDYDNRYLFSLSPSSIPVHSSLWGFSGLIAGSIFIILFFFFFANSHLLLGKRQLSLNEFFLVSLLTGLLTGISLLFSEPSLLYWHSLFSSMEYSANALLSSVAHLSVATLFFAATVYLFFFHVQTGKAGHFKLIFLQILFGLYFILMYNILNSMIFHSSIQLAILDFEDISEVSLWFHFLFFVWGIGLIMLFYKTHSHLQNKQWLQQAIANDIAIALGIAAIFFIFWRTNTVKVLLSYIGLIGIFYVPLFQKKKKKTSSFALLWAISFIVFFLVNTFLINNEKQLGKYHVLAENIHINGNTENDRMADMLLEELDNQISTDKKIQHLSTYSDSISQVNQYINNNYLRGFWNRYDMRLNVAMAGSELQYQYLEFINRTGTRLKNTHFYSVPASYNSMSYIGVFPIQSIEGDSLYMFMEFYPRKNFKSYSFPDLLISSAPDIQSQLKIAVAIYEKGNLTYSSDKQYFQEGTQWIPRSKKEFFSINYKKRAYYIYSPDKNNQIVITKTEQRSLGVIVMYAIYSLASFLLLGWLFLWLNNLRRRKPSFRISFAARFQYSFITLMLISFFGIFYVSVDFIQKKYEDEQVSQIENKKNYIQKALQDMYYWTQDLSTVNQQGLNFDLQELSYMYQTDILVYDNQGVLVGSSQPVIFNKNLISKQISPKPFFSNNSNINQEEHIGNLNYLTGYTDFYNGDFLQIGYIAVPQFLSREEIRAEIESFISVIIHIYLIIIILAIVLSLVIGKQLAAPLTMIENKLRQMRFGHRNEKIDYKMKDEIGQLVAQYNRTVDELENSARLLAQSEREMAWKTMARQIAHEINNPLTPMKLTLQQLLRTKKMDDGRFDEYFEKSTLTLVEQIDNLSRIASTFSNFARMPEAHFVSMDLAARINSVVRLFANNHEQTELHYQGATEGIWIFADPEQLTQVFNNLLKNAMQSIPAERKGKITVTISEDGKNARVDISDNGTGIADEIADKLFTPNFTTKSTGMGLGLSISKNIIEIAGGTIEFTTRPGEGTTFSVTLPLEHQ